MTRTAWAILVVLVAVFALVLAHDVATYAGNPCEQKGYSGWHGDTVNGYEGWTCTEGGRPVFTIPDQDSDL